MRTYTERTEQVTRKYVKEAKCDWCRETVSHWQSVRVSGETFVIQDLCEDCEKELANQLRKIGIRVIERYGPEDE